MADGQIAHVPMKRIFRELYAVAQNDVERASLSAFFQKPAGNDPDLNVQDEDTQIHLQGATYVVGRRTAEILVFAEIYHRRVYDRIASFIPRAGWTVFDAGASIGIFSILQDRRGAQVYAFEPNPSVYRRLSRNVTANGLADAVHVYNLAVGASPGLGDLHVPHGVTVGGTVMPTTDRNATASCVVQITSLDHIVPLLGVTHIDLLKIDTEGAEVEVLYGAAHTLELVERVLIEYHSDALGEEVEMLLTAHGFTDVSRVNVAVNPGVGLLYAAKPS
jgi:FkbM family methyltransferase